MRAFKLAAISSSVILGLACGSVRSENDAAGTDASGSVDGSADVADAAPPDAVVSTTITVSPLTKAFGGQAVGTNTSTETFTFTNASSASATGCAAPALSGANPGDFTIQTDNCGTDDLAGDGGACTVILYGTPSTTGLRTTTLSRTCTVGDTASTTANGIQVTGTGTASVTVSPMTFGFGPVAVGTTSSPHTFTFTNSGTVAATGCSAPTRSGSNAADFTIATDDCGTSDLAPGGSCTVQLRVTPAAAGIRTMTLARTCTGGGTASTDVNGIEVNKPMYIFISSVSYDGNLGGMAGADNLCNTLGAAGSLSGPLNKSWKALLSKTTGGPENAKDRLVWTGPMFDLAGDTVTLNPSSWPWVDAGDGSDIDVNESGGGPGDSYVWTGSTINGVTKGAGYDCNNWSDNTGAFNGWSGETGSFSSSSWFDSFGNACDDDWFSLYCVSQ